MNIQYLDYSQIFADTVLNAVVLINISSILIVETSLMSVLKSGANLCL